MLRRSTPVWTVDSPLPVHDPRGSTRPAARVPPASRSRAPRGASRRRPQAAASLVPSVHLQHRQERLLRNLHRSHLLHPLLSFLLLLQQFALPRDVSTVALGQHVLAQRLDRGPRDHLRADGRLDDHLEELPWDELLQLVGDLAPPVVLLLRVDDYRE